MSLSNLDDVCDKDDEKQVQQVNNQLKEERQARRQLDAQLSAIQEELTELRLARDTLEKVCANTCLVIIRVFACYVAATIELVDNLSRR